MKPLKNPLVKKVGFRQRKLMGMVPLATTLKVTLPPATADWLKGWMAIRGGKITVRLAV